MSSDVYGDDAFERAFARAEAQYWPRFLPRACALLVAAALFCASLTPSLTPRDPVMQGMMSGLVALIGYELGTLLCRFWTFMELPRLRGEALRTARAGLIAVAFAGCTYCLWRAADWQNATRETWQLAPVDSAHPLTVLAYALAIVVAGFVVFRLLGVVFDLLADWLRRVVPTRVSLALAFAVVVYLVWAISDGVLIRNAFRAADASFEAADLLIEPDIPQPSDPMKTGSAQSLIAWDEMGRWGRSFVATAPTIEEISVFHPDAAVQAPVRVYVGRRSGDTAQERADLALQELIRVGGFERKALVVAVPVGTGWMDPGAHDTLDFMLEGDVATVAVQYSYLTSVLSLLAHPEYGVEQARVLFDTIYDYWTELPVDERPTFYVHGLSQGAFNSERTLPLLDMLGDPIAGAMWAGSPFISPVWQRVRDGREPDSTAWRPIYGNSSLARVMNQDGFEPSVADRRWGPIRLVFLNYGSDAIVAFTFDTAYRRPDWMNAPRAPDVAEEFKWYPLVTMFQLALDMMISLQTPGFGHYYIAPDYIDAWAALVEPAGWSEARADDLREIFEGRGPAF
ncbi:MAG: alpha/beta hydrolase [Geminicoccaceae bacterium]